MRQAKGLLRIGFNVALAYKADFILSVISMPVLVTIFYFLWSAIFSASGVTVLQGYTLDQMISYYVLATAIAFLVFSDIDHWMEWDVLHGGYVNHLLKPMAFIKFYYFKYIGIKLLSILIEIIPLLLLGFVFFRLELPTIFNAVLFLMTVFLASLMFFYITFIVGLLAFWMKQIQGISKIKREFISFFSGGLLPLTFFPLWLQSVLQWSPLPYFRFIPINMYLGLYSWQQSLLYCGIGIVWVIVLYLAAMCLWKVAQRHATGVGV